MGEPSYANSARCAMYVCVCRVSDSWLFNISTGCNATRPSQPVLRRGSPIANKLAEGAHPDRVATRPRPAVCERWGPFAPRNGHDMDHRDERAAD